MRLWTTTLVAVALTASVTAAAQTPTSPTIGTWSLNLAKSKYNPGPAPKSETRTYEATAGGIRETIQVETADGSSYTETSIYREDGKPYSLSGTSDIDTHAITRVSSRETRITWMRAGKVVGHATNVISSDGRVMTQTRTLTNAAGQRLQDVRVYDRQ